jgi:hypothetical protein
VLEIIENDFIPILKLESSNLELLSSLYYGHEFDLVHKKPTRPVSGVRWVGATLRENRNFSSVNGFPECQKSSTRGSQSFPSVALGEEMHSGKRDFPKSPNQPDTRRRITLGKIHLPRAQHSEKSRSRGKKVFHDVPTKRRRWGLKLKKFFPESQKNTRGRRSFPSAES